MEWIWAIVVIYGGGAMATGFVLELRGAPRDPVERTATAACWPLVGVAGFGVACAAVGCDLAHWCRGDWPTDEEGEPR